MEAKDTVMSEEGLKAELVKYHLGICQTNPPQMPNQTDVIWQCLEAQAEISFKAGEKQGRWEVIDWLHNWHRDVEEMAEFKDQLEKWGE